MRIWMIVCALWAITTDGQAATRTAATCNLPDVQTVLGQSANGDTLVLPAGTCTWTSQLDVFVGITIQGTGIDVTTLNDNVPKDGSDTSSLIFFHVNAPNTFRLTALTIVGLATNPGGNNKGHVRAYGSANTLRIDHIKLTNMQTGGILLDGQPAGVIDHNTFSKGFQNGVLVNAYAYNNEAWGDGSWAAPDSLGGQNDVVYIETNTFISTIGPSGFAGAVNDCLAGGRFVFRYNDVTADYVQAHGTESGQRNRGCRQWEIYNNTFTYTSNGGAGGDQGGDFFTATYMRSGVGVLYNNTYTNPNPCNGCPVSGYVSLMQLPNFRDTAAYPPWGQCDGTQPYDQNSAGQSGYRCIDQPGGGQGIDYGGADTPPAVWAGNALDPEYQWNNTFGGVTTNTTLGGGHVVGGRDFIDNTPRPGYTPLVYPHPLVTGGGGGGGGGGTAISVSAATTVVTTAQRQAVGLNFWPDGNMGIQNNGTYTFWAPNNSNSRTSQSIGTLDNPIAISVNPNVPISNPVAAFNYQAGGPTYFDSGTGQLLMIYHAELWPNGNAANFWSELGLAKSVDNGATWNDLGLFLQPNYPFSQSNTINVEMGGGQWVVNGSNFYLYFNDRLANTNLVQTCVASASIASVIAAAQLNTVTTWTKFNNGTFSTPGLGGACSSVIPGTNSWWQNVTFNTTLNQYFLTWSDFSNIFYQTSANGLNWSLNPVQITNDGGENLYSTPAGTGSDPRISGSTFYLYYTQSNQGGFNRWNDAVLRRRTITITGTAPPSNSCLGTLTGVGGPCNQPGQ